MKVRTFFTTYALALATEFYIGVASIGAHHPLLTAFAFTCFGFSIHSVVSALGVLRHRSWLMRP